MACSILAISRWMDPVTAPQSVRELARRHRWLTGLPPDPLSLLSICLRHHHPQASIHHVLWYNTFLLQGFELSLCNLLILGRILEKMRLDPRVVVGLIGVTPAEIVDTLKSSKHQLVDGLGITLDELKSTFGDVVDGLLNVLSFGTVDIDVDDILD